MEVIYFKNLFLKGEYIMEPMKFKNMLYGARKPGEILAEGEVGI